MFQTTNQIGYTWMALNYAPNAIAVAPSRGFSEGGGATGPPLCRAMCGFLGHFATACDPTQNNHQREKTP